MTFISDNFYWIFVIMCVIGAVVSLAFIIGSTKHSSFVFCPFCKNWVYKRYWNGHYCREKQRELDEIGNKNSVSVRRYMGAYKQLPEKPGERPEPTPRYPYKTINERT